MRRTQMRFQEFLSCVALLVVAGAVLLGQGTQRGPSVNTGGPIQVVSTEILPESFSVEGKRLQLSWAGELIRVRVKIVDKPNQTLWISPALREVMSAAVLTLCVCATAVSQTGSESLQAAVAAGRVTVVFRGTGASSGDAVELTVTKSSKAGPGELVLTVSPGLRLNSSSATAQSMILAKVRGRALGGEQFVAESEIRLSGTDPVTYIIEAYCADFDKDNPSESVTFSLGREDAVLACIVKQSGSLSVSAIQAAVWIYTGNVTRTAMDRKFSVSGDEWATAQALVQKCRLSAR